MKRAIAENIKEGSRWYYCDLSDPGRQSKEIYVIQRVWGDDNNKVTEISFQREGSAYKHNYPISRFCHYFVEVSETDNFLQIHFKVLARKLSEFPEGITELYNLLVELEI